MLQVLLCFYKHPPRTFLNILFYLFYFHLKKMKQPKIDIGNNRLYYEKG